jgi:hypothetical protein
MEFVKRLLRSPVAASFSDLPLHAYLELQDGWAYVGPKGLYVRRKNEAVFTLYSPDQTALYPLTYKVLPPDHAQLLFYELLFRHMLAMPAHVGALN